jgi:hypothetical protein
MSGHGAGSGPVDSERAKAWSVLFRGTVLFECSVHWGAGLRRRSAGKGRGRKEGGQGGARGRTLGAVTLLRSAAARRRRRATARGSVQMSSAVHTGACPLSELRRADGRGSSQAIGLTASTDSRAETDPRAVG